MIFPFKVALSNKGVYPFCQGYILKMTKNTKVSFCFPTKIFSENMMKKIVCRTSAKTWSIIFFATPLIISKDTYGLWKSALFLIISHLWYEIFENLNRFKLAISSLLTLSDPRGGPFCPLFSQSIANASWLGISVSMPDGFSSWRYINCLVKLDTLFIIELF